MIKASAAKALDELPRKDLKRVSKKIQGLAIHPRPRGCEKLSAGEKYRIGQGNYRVVYSVDDGERSVLIVKIAHRKEAYR